MPANKVFIVTNTNFGPIGSGSSICKLAINGQNLLVKETLFTNAVLAPGTVLSTANCTIPTQGIEMATINGYFLDY